ncbi:hypothetical protein [Sphingomonas sp. GB1N7]|uniref:hypothetical protein n=1 Tax=Parasphingomonas caseinilytica TaxID=3096158 RepID=UPI002FCB996B
MEFAYHRSLGPMIGVLLGIAIVEMCVVHLVVAALWGWIAAVIVGVIDLSLVVWLVALLRSFKRLPVTIVGGVLKMQAGSLRSVTIPVGQIAGLRKSWDAAAIKDRGVLNLALASWPSVVVDLREPIVMRRGRAVKAIAHKLDDPAAFHAAIVALSPRDGH